MGRRARVVVAAAAALGVVAAGTAQAKFDVKVELNVTGTNAKANPTVNVKLSFAKDDAEIGLFTLFVPPGYVIANDALVPDVPASTGRPQGDLLGAGKVTIQGGPGCHPQFPVKEIAGPITIDAKIYERPVAEDEKFRGAIAAWVLDIEPLNRVRLLVTGNPSIGYSVSGAPTPSDATCNPLAVDITINGKTEKGVALFTSPAAPGPRQFRIVVRDADAKQFVEFKKVVVTTP